MEGKRGREGPYFGKIEIKNNRAGKHLHWCNIVLINYLTGKINLHYVTIQHILPMFHLIVWLEKSTITRIKHFYLKLHFPMSDIFYQYKREFFLPSVQKVLSFFFKKKLCKPKKCLLTNLVKKQNFTPSLRNVHTAMIGWLFCSFIHYFLIFLDLFQT